MKKKHIAGEILIGPMSQIFQTEINPGHRIVKLNCFDNHSLNLFLQYCSNVKALVYCDYDGDDVIFRIQEPHAGQRSFYGGLITWLELNGGIIKKGPK